jgi:hypothetical protein
MDRIATALPEVEAVYTTAGNQDVLASHVKAAWRPDWRS